MVKSVGFGVGWCGDTKKHPISKGESIMNKLKSNLVGFLLIPLLLLSGCTPIGNKTASMTFIYMATTFLAFLLLVGAYSSARKSSPHASEAMCQSPRGERLTEPTLGPSGRHERLNCWLKNLLMKVFNHFFMVSSS